jgi:hypothetical protein
MKQGTVEKAISADPRLLLLKMTSRANAGPVDSAVDKTSFRKNPILSL